MTKDLHWLKLLGGFKTAVMWYTDFSCFLVWQHFSQQLTREQATGLDGAAIEYAKLDPIQSFLDRDDQIAFALSSKQQDEFKTSFYSFLKTSNTNLFDSDGTFDLVLGISQFLTIRGLIDERLEPEELRYYTALGFRRRHGLDLDETTARNTQQACDALNKRILEKRQDLRVKEIDLDKQVSSGVELSASEISKCIGDFLGNPYLPPVSSSPQNPGALFCYLQLAGDLTISDSGKYQYNEEACDAEFVLSRFFGFPMPGTGIDQLFGGGGIFLYDQAGELTPGQPIAEGIMPGRIVLLRGGFGSGKTSAGLTFAASIAQMGGLAIYFAMEFDIPQTRFSLERLGFPTENGRFEIFSNVRDCIRHFRIKRSAVDGGLEAKREGAILVLEVSPDELHAFEGRYLFRLMQAFAKSDLPVFPRAVVIDSLNAIKKNLVQDLMQENRIAKTSKQQTKLTESATTEASPTEVKSSEPSSDDPNVSRTDNADVDNSVIKPKAPDGVTNNHSADLRVEDPEVRRGVLQGLRQVTNRGTNVILLSEEDDNFWTAFGEDIADTVIRLYGPIETWQSSKSQLFGQTFRTINITKSRYQKEHPGAHPFRIVPGEGIRVFLSTETRGAILRGKAERHLTPRRFGVPHIDRLLSNIESSNAASDLKVESNCGRVVFLEGELGTFKTQFGICFLQAAQVEDEVCKSNLTLSESASNSRGLLISMRYDDVDIGRKEREDFCRDARYGESPNPPKVLSCKLPSGNVFPDEIILKIKKQFDDADAANTPIKRVLLDNPGEWEDLCPLLADDPLFAGTLMSFLRTRGARILVTNRLLAAKESRLIRAILEQVESLIKLERRVLAGNSVNTIQINRSPGMKHNPSVHEIVTKNGIQFRPLESVAQYDKDGRILPTKVRILRRRQTSRSELYWENVVSLIRSLLPSELTMEETGSFGHRFNFQLSKESVFDSLNIIEIDEFELEAASLSLRRLSNSHQGSSEYKHRFATKLGSLVNGEGKKDICERVVPFFDNSSCLLIDKASVSKIKDEPDALRDLQNRDIDWGRIAELSEKWHRLHENSTGGKPFFSFPVAESENWNSLYLEIAFAEGCRLEGEIEGERTTFNSLIGKTLDEVHSWLFKASLIFHKLLNKPYEHVIRSGPYFSTSKYDSSALNAVVSRQWFTTLNQTLEDMKTLAETEWKSEQLHEKLTTICRSEPKDDLQQKIPPVTFDPSNFFIRRLPSNVSVSGEWYLGILAGSVRAPAGEEFLKYMSGRAADSDRFRLGVGLPVTEPIGFARNQTSSPYASCFDSDFFVEGGPESVTFIDRSSIKDYHEHTARFTEALKRIVRLNLELDDDSDSSENEQRRKNNIKLVRDVWAAFLEAIKPKS